MNETLRQNLFPIPPPLSVRGIAPDRLLSQVHNTAPFLFSPEWTPAADEPHLARLRAWAPSSHLDEAEYFALCLSAHHATVATFVPTDVDNAIRFKLWAPHLELRSIVRMADTVEASFQWSFRRVSTRWVASPRTGETVSGHHGEWFSTAAGSYGALRQRHPARASLIREQILAELHRQAQVFQDLRQARDGIGLLKAATLLAHNMGDLNRVIEMWQLPPGDRLREETAATARGIPELVQAGALNRAYMAIENHRHFALRAPRALRKSADFLLPTGPFFDDWGRRLARHPDLNPLELGTIAAALIDGWERLCRKPVDGLIPVGYARALAGLEGAYPGGLTALTRELTARHARQLKQGPLRALLTIPQERFERTWAAAALKFLAAT